MSGTGFSDHQGPGRGVCVSERAQISRTAAAVVASGTEEVETDRGNCVGG